MGERIVMLGGGAVGGYVGGHLALHGHDVTLIDFWHEQCRGNSQERSRTLRDDPGRAAGFASENHAFA